MDKAFLVASERTNSGIPDVGWFCVESKLVIYIFDVILLNNKRHAIVDRRNRFIKFGSITINLVSKPTIYGYGKSRLSKTYSYPLSKIIVFVFLNPIYRILILGSRKVFI